MAKSKNQLALPGTFPAELNDIWKKLGSRYSFDSQIGSGNNGVAFKVSDSVTQKPFCLKTLKFDLVGKDRKRALDSLKKEVEILLPLSHAAIPRIYDYFFDSRGGYYLCNFHPGETLAAFLTTTKRFDTHNSGVFLSLLFDSVEQLHVLGRSHCDLHSKNLMVADNVVKDGILIIDFGSGHRESDSSPNTENRGNRLFKIGAPTYGDLVNRYGAKNAFIVYDLVAMGHLLSQADNALYWDAPPAQKQAFRSFYRRLLTMHLTDWKAVRKALLQVSDPFRIVNEMEVVFFSDKKENRYIPLPISRNVTVGDACLEIINCEVFQKLRGVKQLSFCEWYFPGATHTRFEHSLGVFHLAHIALRELAWNDEFRDQYTSIDLKACVLAALLHDIGHYPFAHMLEHYAASHFPGDWAVKDAVSHSQNSMHIVKGDGELRSAISRSWGDVDIYVERIEAMLSGQSGVLSELLDGPIDCDKIDYLARDSFHCGVPYARHLDPETFLRRVRCLPECKGLGVMIDAVPAVESFLILQEHMLANVYWNEWIRSVICMFHAALAHIVKDNRDKFILLVEQLKRCSDDSSALRDVLIPELQSVAKDGELLKLIELHTRYNFKEIYRPIAIFRHFDPAPAGKRANLFSQLVTWTPSGTGSGIPINWSVVKQLRQTFQDEFKKQGFTAKAYEIIIDVPTGKNALPKVNVLSTSGEIIDLSRCSHLNDTIFTQPAVFASPIRVFISPKLFERSKERLKSILSAVTEGFLK